MREDVAALVDSLVYRWDKRDMVAFAYEVTRLYSTTSDYDLISEVMFEFRSLRGPTN